MKNIGIGKILVLVGTILTLVSTFFLAFIHMGGLIIAILIVTGGAIVIIGGLIGNKFFGILGGVVMLAGAILLTIAIFRKSGIFDDIAQTLLVDNFFWGSEPIVDWGVWIGFFLAIGGGILGLIGGATID